MVSLILTIDSNELSLLMWGLKDLYSALMEDKSGFTFDTWFLNNSFICSDIFHSVVYFLKEWFEFLHHLSLTANSKYFLVIYQIFI